MKYYLFFILIFVACVQAADEEPSINDYANGIELLTDEQAAIYKLLLPKQVYKSVTRSDLGDLRIFNQANEPVPHIIRQQKITGKPVTVRLTKDRFWQNKTSVNRWHRSS